MQGAPRTTLVGVGKLFKNIRLTRTRSPVYLFRYWDREVGKIIAEGYIGVLLLVEGYSATYVYGSNSFFIIRDDFVILCAGVSL